MREPRDDWPGTLFFIVSIAVAVSGMLLYFHFNH